MTSTSLSASGTDRPPGRLAMWLLALLVVVATVAAFLPTLANDFVNWDDETNFLNNYEYRGLGRDNLRWMFTAFHRGHYQPLAWVTLALDYKLWGMNPRGYHLTALVIHALSAVTVFFLGRKLLHLAVPKASPDAWPLALSAAAAALLFSIHPLRVESVAWATERRLILSSLFFLLAVLTYVRAHEARLAGRRDWGWFALAIVCTLLSLLSQVIAVTLVPVLLALDYYPLRRLGGQAGWFRPSCLRVWLEKTPFLIAAGVFFPLAIRAQAASDMELHFDLAGLLSHLFLALFGLSFYLWKTLLPIGLSPLYERPLNVAEIELGFVLAGVGVAAAAFWTWLRRRRRPGLLTAFVCYLAPLAPVLGTYRTWPQSAADRYTYLPSVSVSLLAGAGLLHLFVAARGNAAARRRARGVAAASVACLVILGVLTWRQTRVWTDSIRLWTRVLAVEPRSYYGHLHLGKSLMTAGRTEEAVALYRTAVALRPEDPQGYVSLGIGLHLLGQSEKARQAFERAIALRPDDSDIYRRLGIVLRQGRRYAEALAVLQQGAGVAPPDLLLTNELASLLATCPDGDIRNGPQAVALAEFACGATGYRVPALLDTLAAAYAEVGRFDDAIKTLDKAIERAKAVGQEGLAASLADHRRIFERREPLRLP